MPQAGRPRGRDRRIRPLRRRHAQRLAGGGLLATAREIRAQYEFSSHARLAREAGVSEDKIQAIARGTAPEGLSGDEELLVRYTQELLRDHKISDASFNAVLERFGVQGTVELTVLIGHYTLAGQFMAAFDVELSPDMTPELPL